MHPYPHPALDDHALWRRGLVRARGEFVGKTTGYDDIEARVEIPGARWLHAGADGDVNDISVYDGGSMAWSSDPRNPVINRQELDLPDTPQLQHAGA